MVWIWLYTIFVNSFAFLSLITSGTLKMLFLGLELGVLIGQIIFTFYCAKEL